MPRSIRSQMERRRSNELYNDRKRRLNREKPLASPCRDTRRQHRFRSNKVRGPLNINNPRDAERSCWWCRKTFAQVVKEQREARKRKK